MILKDFGEILVTKFHGVLNDVSFDNVDETLIEFLLKKDIIYISDIDSNCNFNSEEFEIPLYFNEVIYSFNYELLEEVYLCLRFCVEFDSIDVQYENDALLYKLNRFLDDKDKIKYLNQEYQKWFPDSILYSVYDSNIQSRNQEFTNWKDYVYDVIGSYPLFVQMYLNTTTTYDDLFGWIRSTLRKNKNLEDDYLFSDLIGEWTNFMKSGYMLNIIKSEIEKIENPKVINKKKLDESIITIESLFINKSEYLRIINDLILNNIVSDKMEIIIPNKYEKRGSQSFICALMVQFDNNGFLKFCNDVDKVMALNNTFKVNISKQNYNAFLNSSNQNVYLSYTSFINKSVRKNVLSF